MAKAIAEDATQEMMALLVEHWLNVLRDAEQAKEMKAADWEFLRKLMQDNSITIASVRQGSFGAFAQKVADDLPFSDEGPVFN